MKNKNTNKKFVCPTPTLETLSVDFGGGQLIYPLSAPAFAAKHPEGAKATKFVKQPSVSLPDYPKDIPFIIPNFVLEKEILRDYLSGSWNYEVLFTIDRQKFKEYRVTPTNNEFIHKINKFLCKYIDDISVYGIYETTKKNDKNLHLHAIVSIDKTTHKSVRKIFNNLKQNYERLFGMIFSARINSLYERYVPTDKQRVSRTLGSFDSYYEYIHKTLFKHSCDSVYRGIIDTL